MTVTNEIALNCPELLISTDPIKEVASFGYLGIHVDRYFKFILLTNHLKGKLSKMCGVSVRLSVFLDFQSEKYLYNSCICSVSSYCIGVLGGVSHCTSRCDDLNRFHKEIKN